MAAGSIAYSAVSQPCPEPLRQRGTPSVTLAVHMTRVSPNSTSTEPAGWEVKPRVMRHRSQLVVEPAVFSSVTRGNPNGVRRRSVTGGRRCVSPHTTACTGPSNSALASLMTSSRDVHGGMWVSSSSPHAGPLGDLAGLGARQMQMRRALRGVRPRRLAQEHVGAGGQLDQRLAHAGVAAVDQRGARRVGDPHPVGLGGMAHQPRQHRQRARSGRARRPPSAGSRRCRRSRRARRPAATTPPPAGSRCRWARTSAPRPLAGVGW